MAPRNRSWFLVCSTVPRGPRQVVVAMVLIKLVVEVVVLEAIEQLATDQVHYEEQH